MARQDAHGRRYITVKNEDGEILEEFDFTMNNIRSVGHWIDGFWSLNPLSEALSKRTAFSDVDAHVELEGHSLILEFKRSLFKMNKGQTMKAIRQARFQRTSTWFIEGDTDKPRYMVKVTSTGVDGEFRISDLKRIDLEELRDQIQKWEKWAKRFSLVKGNKTIEWDAVQEVMDRCFQVRD